MILLAGPTGFEPAIFSVTGRRDRPTSLRARVWLQVSYQFFASDAMNIDRLFLYGEMV